MIDFEFATATHVGRVRKNNEDAVAVSVGAQLAVLADGMGGYQAGEVASEMAVSIVRADLTQWQARAGAEPSAAETRRAMEQSVDKANRAILRKSDANPACAGMGTTLVVAAFQGSRLMLGHIGDSRCYRLRGGALEQLTRDHSWVQEQLDAGVLTSQQTVTAQQRCVVTRALGVEGLVALDVNEFHVQANDLYLLCSDGLSEMVSDAQLVALLEQPLSLRAHAERLIDAANANGGRDNISVILALAHTGEPKRRTLSLQVRG